MTQLEEDTLRVKTLRRVITMTVFGYDNSGRPCTKSPWSDEEMAGLKKTLIETLKKIAQ